MLAITIGEEVLVIKREMMDNAQPVCDNAKLKDIAKMVISAFEESIA